MKKAIFLILLVVTLGAKAQLLVNLQLPPTGVVQKSQVWEMTLVNTTPATMVVHIEMMLSDISSNMQVLGAVTPPITLPPGTTHINYAKLQPVQYNVLSPDFVVDPGPNGLLPVGNFDICYSYLAHRIEYVEKIAEQCEGLIIEPIGAPQLVFPFDGAIIENASPQFNWLAPMPASLFTNLRYDLDLVEVYPTQQPSDAIQQNIPLIQQHDVVGNSFMYPAGAQRLEQNKTYAWRISAKSNDSRIAETETWSFTLKNSNTENILKGHDLPYVKLSKEDRGGYAISLDELKFDYLNESGERIWNLKIVDITDKNKKLISVEMDSIPLKPGQNLVKLNLKRHNGFVNKHLYQMEVANSRQEVWRLKFEFRRSED